MNFIPLLQANAAEGSSFVTIIMFALIFAIFYFFIIRPQNKKQKETERMINALKKGDKVITIGGIHGVVSAVRENTFVVKVEDGSKIEFSRSAISSVVNADPEKSEKIEKKAAKAEKIEKSEPEEKAEEESEPREESGDNSGEK